MGGKSHSGWDTLKRIIIRLMKPTRIMSGCCCCNHLFLSTLFSSVPPSNKKKTKNKSKEMGNKKVGGGESEEMIGGGGASRDAQQGWVEELLQVKKRNKNKRARLPACLPIARKKRGRGPPRYRRLQVDHPSVLGLVDNVFIFNSSDSTDIQPSVRGKQERGTLDQLDMLNLIK